MEVFGTHPRWEDMRHAIQMMRYSDHWDLELNFVVLEVNK